MAVRTVQQISVKFNDPIRASTKFLETLDDTYIADAKVDGWRVRVIKENGRIRSITKKFKSVDIGSDIIEELSSLPDNTIIEAEWVNRSRITTLNNVYNKTINICNKLVVFDVIKWEGVMIAGDSINNRRKCPWYMKLPSSIDFMQSEHTVFSVYNVDRDFLNSYNEIITYFINEGVVVKKKSGDYNSTWVKVKNRE